MNRYVQVSDHMTAERFGCDPEYFDHHIKGKSLRVTAATANLVCVVDGEDEAWSIMTGDYVDLSKRPIPEK